MSNSHAPTDKPLIVVATPRSGSTLFYSVLSEYARQTSGALAVGEYFNTKLRHFAERDGRIAVSARPGRGPRSQVLRERFALLRRHHSTVCIKLFPHHVPESYLPWLHDRYSWVYVERRDRFQQYLSYLISYETGIWYTRGGIRVQPGSLNASREAVQSFFDLRRRYTDATRRYEGRQTLYYEDFDGAPDPREMLVAAQCDRAVDLSTVNLRERQNAGNKLTLFKNVAFLTEAFARWASESSADAPRQRV